MPSRHSSIVGGSSAARVLNCPGSTALLAQLPQVLDRDSFYSVEGTVLHSVMERLISGKITLKKLPSQVTVKDRVIAITPELIHDAVLPAMAYWDELLTKIDYWQLETEVRFPGIDGAFGTADVLARDDRDNKTYVSDWKFGAGEGVKASYSDPQDPFIEIVNEQLLFYAVGARHTQPEFFPADCRIILTIVQPRARTHDPITSVEVTMEELTDFELALRDAVAETLRPDARTNKGRWCRFQACQTICPHFTGPLFDLNTLSQQVPAVHQAPGYELTLLDILNAAPAVEELIREARAQAHLILTDGGVVPGWKLVAKRAIRQWAVEPPAIAKAVKIPEQKLYDTVLKSPAQVEKLMIGKKKLPDGLAVPVSSGTTIAPEADKRPAISGDPNEISKILLEALDTDA